MDKKIIAFKGTPVFNPNKPRDLRYGGYVYSSKAMTQEQLNNDSVISILRPGEIVIPVKHEGHNLANKTRNWLKSQNITLPFMKR
jgi:hypothetical protein